MGRRPCAPPCVVADAASSNKRRVAVNEKAIKPSVAWVVEQDKNLVAYLERPKPQIARLTLPAKKPVPVATGKRIHSACSGSASGCRRAAETSKAAVAAAAPPPLELAPQPDEPALTPAPDANPPSAAELARVLAHMKVSLTKELYANFELFPLCQQSRITGPWQHAHVRLARKRRTATSDVLYNLFRYFDGQECADAGTVGTLAEYQYPAGLLRVRPRSHVPALSLGAMGSVDALRHVLHLGA